MAERDSDTTQTTSMPTDALNSQANSGEPDLDPQMAGIGRDTVARMDELDLDVEARMDAITYDTEARMDAITHDTEARMDAIGLDADTMRSLEAPPDDSESGRTP